MHGDRILKEDNVIDTQEDFQFPSSNYQQEIEGHEACVEMLDRPNDMVQGKVPTSLPPLATSC